MLWWCYDKTAATVRKKRLPLRQATYCFTSFCSRVRLFYNEINTAIKLNAGESLIKGYYYTVNTDHVTLISRHIRIKSDDRKFTDWRLKCWDITTSCFRSFFNANVMGCTCEDTIQNEALCIWRRGATANPLTILTFTLAIAKHNPLPRANQTLDTDYLML
jgi:hypothetical protein